MNGIAAPGFGAFMIRTLRRYVRFLAFGIIPIACLPNATGQFFVNLSFDETTITPSQYGNGYTATLHGWRWNTFNFVNDDPNSVPYNTLALSAPAVTLHGRNSPYFPWIINGYYSVVLQGGDFEGGLNYGTNGASIFQTGLIPDGSKSLIYLSGAPLQVSFNGQMLTPIALSNAVNHTVWGADVSAYGGQSGELRFTVPWLSGQFPGVSLDDIRFSPTPVPEPSVLALSSLFIFWLLRMMMITNPGGIRRLAGGNTPGKNATK